MPARARSGEEGRKGGIMPDGPYNGTSSCKGARSRSPYLHRPEKPTPSPDRLRDSARHLEGPRTRALRDLRGADARLLQAMITPDRRSRARPVSPTTTPVLPHSQRSMTRLANGASQRDADDFYMHKPLIGISMLHRRRGDRLVFSATRGATTTRDRFPRWRAGRPPAYIVLPVGPRGRSNALTGESSPVDSREMASSGRPSKTGAPHRDVEELADRMARSTPLLSEHAILNLALEIWAPHHASLRVGAHAPMPPPRR